MSLTTVLGPEYHDSVIAPGKPPVMNEEELRCLAGDGLISIGAHGVTHGRLNRLDPAVARLEVRDWTREEFRAALEGQI